MSEAFIAIVNMSISASWIIAAVMIVRLLLKKAPKWISVMLWGIVGIRLVCPFSIESALSLIPSAHTVNYEMMTDKSPEINSGIPFINDTLNPVISDSLSAALADSVNPMQILLPVLSVIWLAGMAAMLIYAAVSYIMLKKRVANALPIRDNVFSGENVASPFVLGIIKPKIYLPANISERDAVNVIAHEKAHIRRRDHLIKPIGFLLLCVYWFNPLVWLGYILLCKDIELACDERAVKNFSLDQLADYSQALLSCSVNRRIIAACPIAFGEVSVKSRVKSVLNYKKPAFWVVAAAIAASIAVAVCFLTSPKTDDIVASDGEPGITSSGAGTLEVSNADNTVSNIIGDGNSYVEANGVSVSGIERAEMPGVYPKADDTDSPDYENGESGTQDFVSVIPDTKQPSSTDGISASSYYFDIDIKKYQNPFDFGIFKSGYSRANRIYSEALNKDKMPGERGFHQPVYKFDTVDDLVNFRETFKKDFYSTGVLSDGYFDTSLATKYNDSFFKNNSLILIYVEATSGTYLYKVHSVEYDEKSFLFHVIENSKAELFTADMQGWFLTVGVPKSLIKSGTSFDADLNNRLVLQNMENKSENPTGNYAINLDLYVKTPLSQTEDKIESGEYIITRTHHETLDGKWTADNREYEYRLQITGRMGGAAKNTTFIVLSNKRNIRFSETWPAFGYGSDTSAYFDPDEAVIVGYRIF